MALGYFCRVTSFVGNFLREFSPKDWSKREFLRWDTETKTGREEGGVGQALIA